MKVNPVLAAADQIISADRGTFGTDGPMAPTPFIYPVADF